MQRINAQSASNLITKPTSICVQTNYRKTCFVHTSAAANQLSGRQQLLNSLHTTDVSSWDIRKKLYRDIATTLRNFDEQYNNGILDFHVIHDNPSKDLGQVHGFEFISYYKKINNIQ